LFLAFAGICLPQSAPKPKTAPAKSGAPATSPAAKAQSKEAPEEPAEKADPNALFPAVVAAVNGKPIYGRELEQWVRMQLAELGDPEWRNLREEYRGQLVMSGLTTLISSKLIYEKAVASGMKITDAEVQAEIQKISKDFKSDAEMNAALAAEHMDRTKLQKNLQQSLLIAKYIEENITKKIAITPDEIAKYYSAHPSEFQHPDIVRTSHILIIPAGDTPEQDALAKKKGRSSPRADKKGRGFCQACPGEFYGWIGFPGR